MQTTRYAYLLTAAAIAVAVWRLQPDPEQTAAPTESLPTSMQSSSGGLAAQTSITVDAANSSDVATPATEIDALWLGVLAAPERREALKRVQHHVTGDPEALDALADRYRTARDRSERDALMLVLTTAPMTPHVFRVAQQLTASADAAERRDGFVLLQRMLGTTADTRRLIAQTLATEQDSGVLSQAVLALGSNRAEAPESAALAQRLPQLALHADADVRSASVRTSAYWTDAATAEAVAYQALSDQSASVRLAAVAAVAESTARSGRVKTQLLRLVIDTNEPLRLRRAAAHVLQNFKLSPAEEESVRRAGEQAERLPKTEYR